MKRGSGQRRHPTQARGYSPASGDETLSRPEARYSVVVVAVVHIQGTQEYFASESSTWTQFNYGFVVRWD